MPGAKLKFKNPFNNSDLSFDLMGVSIEFDKALSSEASLKFNRNFDLSSELLARMQIEGKTRLGDAHVVTYMENGNVIYYNLVGACLVSYSIETSCMDCVYDGPYEEFVVNAKVESISISEPS